MNRIRFPAGRTLVLIAACLLLLAACSDRAIPTAVSPTEGETGRPLSAAKGGGKDKDSRAIFTFHDDVPNGAGALVPAVIKSDGKGAYTGDECGIRGKIFWYNWDDARTGDAVFDPDFKRDARCPDWPRQLLINGTPVGPFMNIMNIMNDPDRTDPSDPDSPLPPGRVWIAWIDGAIASNGVPCDGLRFKNDETTGALWMEVRKSVKGTNPATSTPGLWEVYSDPSKGHLAECNVDRQGMVGLVYAPFHVTVEEVFVF